MQELQEKGVHHHAQEKHGKKQMINLNEYMFRTIDYNTKLRGELPARRVARTASCPVTSSLTYEYSRDLILQGN